MDLKDDRSPGGAVTHRLEVDSLTHSFGQNRVLAGIYLRCDSAQIVGILGPNGCGKTTMLRALFGDLIPDSMHLAVDGLTIDHAYRTEQLGYLAQEPFLPRAMRVAQAVHALIADRDDAEEVLRHERIEPIRDRRIGSLSGGEERYLEVLTILALPAPFVFLDEPFTEIEPIHRESLKSEIRKAARTGNRGVLITDHAYRDILDTADRIEVFAGGVLRPAPDEADLKRLGYTP